MLMTVLGQHDLVGTFLALDSHPRILPRQPFRINTAYAELGIELTSA
jgi:hypothetical protein